MDVVNLWRGFLSIVAALIIMVIGMTQYLNHTGFCYAEKRYLSERELVDRALFGKKADAMSFEEKVETARAREYPTGVDFIEYPECCRVYPDSDSFKIFGYYRYQIGYYFAMTDKYAQNHEPKYPHKSGEILVDSCGGMRKSRYGFSESQESYDSAIARNKKYWEEKGK